MRIADNGKSPRPNGGVHVVASCIGSGQCLVSLRDGVSADLEPVTCHLDASRNGIVPPTVGGRALFVVQAVCASALAAASRRAASIRSGRP
jgi:hypothetical protein